MGKETKEMLRTILSNQELIMKHLKITKAAAPAEKKETKEEAKKPAPKPATAKPKKAVKK